MGQLRGIAALHLQLQQTSAENGDVPGRYRQERRGNSSAKEESPPSAGY